jgi:threonine/homoserine/homoserine lactone efflux protein
MTPRRPRPFWRNWAAGIGINLLNPKIILFFMTFLPQFVGAHDRHAPGKLLFLGAMFVLVSLPVTIPLVFMAHGFSQMLRRTPAVTRVVDYLFAGIFTAFAVRILTAQTR